MPKKLDSSAQYLEKLYFSRDRVAAPQVAEWSGTDWNKTRHLPGRKSSESRTIVNVTQSKSCRLAVICGPLLPIPIHSVRMEFLDCFSSTLRLRKIRQKFVFLPKRCHSKGAPVFRAALGGGVCWGDGPRGAG